MKKNLKVFLYKDNSVDLTPHHRPFYPTKKYNVDITKNIDDADYILTSPFNYTELKNDPSFTSYLKKVVVYANDDNPNHLLKEPNSRKFIGQPLQSEEELEKFNATTIPLLMTDHKTIHLDEEFIEKCRNWYCTYHQTLIKSKRITSNPSGGKTKLSFSQFHQKIFYFL